MDFKRNTADVMKTLFFTPLAAAAMLVAANAPAVAAAPQFALPNAALIAATKLAPSQHNLGPVPGSPVDFSVVLPYRHPSELPQLIAAQRNPASPYYRRFMTAAQFRNYFSPTVAAYAAAQAQLVKSGFTVETFANRTVLHATGKASAAEAFFNTRITTVRQADGRIRYANVTPAVIPASLAGSRVVGLNGLVNAQVAPRTRPAAVRPAQASPLFGPDGGFGPAAINVAEDFPIMHGYTGKNSNVADIIDGSVADSDIAVFLSEYGLHRSGPRTTVINVDGGCGSLCFDGFQATIDVEWILSSAPGASMFIYEIPQLTNGGIVDGFNAITSDAAVNVVNFAVAACEVSGGDLQLALEPVIAQGAAIGIAYNTITFGGANTCDVPPLVLPVTPANLDTVTAVGGSSTFTDQTGKQLNESAFNNSNGGVSIVVPLPAYQSKTPGINTSGRNVPDIVLPASVDGTGSSVYYAGAWAGGFTFVNNAPYSGYLATVQEMYGYTTPLGNVAPALYTAYDKFGYAGSTPLFADVKLGCIGAVGGTPVCAKAGYDITGGIGSIAHGYLLAQYFGFGPLQAPTK